MSRRHGGRGSSATTWDASNFLSTKLTFRSLTYSFTGISPLQLPLHKQPTLSLRELHPRYVVERAAAPHDDVDAGYRTHGIFKLTMHSVAIHNHGSC
jgi:hypothetical protein